jgi:predicted N-acetyltransferase YhbS
MQAAQYILATEMAEDWWEVEALYDLSFAPGRSALSSYRLRDDVDPVQDLCLVARDRDGVLAGAVRNWPVRVGRFDCIILGPIAVHPTRQGEGLAALLMGRCIEQAKQLNWDRMMLVGDAPYYSRFGFDVLTGVVMPPPTNPDRVLGIDLTDGGWAGVTGQVQRVSD